MKNIKKFISIVLCMFMILSSVAVVSANEGEFSGIVSKEVNVSGNGDVEVLIDLAGNPGITALRLEVSYDSSVLTLKENGVEDTGLLIGNVQTTVTENPFRLGWQHSDATAANNYKNGTIAKVYFKMKEGFYGTSDIKVKVLSAQSFINDIFVRPPVTMENGVISVTREKLAIKDGAVIANGINNQTLIIASYDGEKLVDSKIYRNSADDLQLQISDVLNTNGATKVKAFLWESLEGCKPVCESIETEL